MKLICLALSVCVIAGCNSSDGEKAASDADSTTSSATSPVGTPASQVDSTDNVLSDIEQSEGFKLLFDGKSKSGFHVYNGVADGSAWKIVDGTLHLDPQERKDAQTQTTGGGDLVTDDEYGDFHLKLDWKVDTSGNSGVLLYIKEDKKYKRSWHTGLEMQVLDNAGHPDSKNIKHRSGDLYDLITSAPETVKPALEWNHVEIISSRRKLEFFLNGTKVVSTTIGDEKWKEMVANSKFKPWPDFMKSDKGKIGLQDHGNKVWFKNIKIKTL